MCPRELGEQVAHVPVSLNSWFFIFKIFEEPFVLVLQCFKTGWSTGEVQERINY